MAGERIQCLLFVLHATKLDVGKAAALLNRSKVKGFALLPQAAEDKVTKFRESLTQSGFPVLSDEQDHAFLKLTERNANAEVIEILLDEVPSDGPSQECRSVIPNCFVNFENVDIVVSLLGVGVGRKRKGDTRNVCSAVDEGNTKVLERVIRCGANISLRHPNGGTILHLAVKRGHDALVRILLTHDADADVRRNDGSTALHIASLAGYTTIVESLLQHKANPNVITCVGLFINSTPLHIAVRKGHYLITELLLAHGADIDAEDFKNRTSLTLSVEWEYLQAVEIILNHRLVDVGKTNMKTLCRAVHTRKIEFSRMVTLRLEYVLAESLKEIYNRNRFHNEIFENSFAIIEQLSKCGENCAVDEPLTLEHVALTAVAGLTAEDVMTAFLGYGTDSTAFERGNRLKVVELLMNHGARRSALNEANRSLFHIACKDGSLEIVEMLLQNGFGPNFMTPNEEEAPLLGAARNGHANVVKTLLEFGALIEVKNSQGHTALHVGAGLNKMEVVGVLLDHGADLYNKCYEEKTPLIAAAEAGLPLMVNRLLSFDSRIVLKDGVRLDAIHHALRSSKDRKTAKVIVSHSFLELLKLNDASFNILSSTCDNPNCVLGKRQLPATCCMLLRELAHKVEAMHSKTLEKKASSRQRQAEVIRLKKQRVGDSDVSLFNLLMWDIDKVAAHLRNSSIPRSVNEAKFLRRFPLFGLVLFCHLSKGRKRNDLISKGAHFCRFLFSSVSSEFSSLPFGIPEKIVVYLSNQDIGILINAFSRKYCKPKQ